MNDIAVRVENLWKLYRIGTQREKAYPLRDLVGRTASKVVGTIKTIFHPSRVGQNRTAGKVDTGHGKGDRASREQWLWVLKGVSFELKCGEVLGIIGRNGSGKSTLLKILSRITEPTKGFAEIFGRTGSLLEVGTGFHPELTGRENVFLNGAILGMKRVEIERKFDTIVAFSEIEKFIDTPVKYYSSGMYVRLAFAVAAHLEPDVLFADEVLAVGDGAFQKKCLRKIESLRQDGNTIVFVSHDLRAVREICNQTLWLVGGQIEGIGKTEEVTKAYEQYLSSAKT